MNHLTPWQRATLDQFDFNKPSLEVQNDVFLAEITSLDGATHLVEIEYSHELREDGQTIIDYCTNPELGVEMDESVREAIMFETGIKNFE